MGGLGRRISRTRSQLIRRAVMVQNITRKEGPLVLHFDNGSPMKGASMLETLIIGDYAFKESPQS